MCRLFDVSSIKKFFQPKDKKLASVIPEEESPTYINPIIVCSCGVLLPTKEGVEAHRSLGHFDLPDYTLSEEQKLEIIRIIKGYRCFALGRSGRNEKGEKGCEVYYFWHDNYTPMLFWDDDPQISSAFAVAAEAYAAKMISLHNKGDTAAVELFQRDDLPHTLSSVKGL